MNAMEVKLILSCAKISANRKAAQGKKCRFMGRGAVIFYFQQKFEMLEKH